MEVYDGVKNPCRDFSWTVWDFVQLIDTDIQFILDDFYAIIYNSASLWLVRIYISNYKGRFAAY